MRLLFVEKSIASVPVIDMSMLSFSCANEILRGFEDDSLIVVSISVD